MNKGNKGVSVKERESKTDDVVRVPAWKSPWVWGMAILVTTMLVVNFTMITIGLNTHTGLVVDDFYAKGKAYLHEEVKHNEAEKRLQWRMVLKEPSTPKLNQLQQYQFILKDKQGEPISDAEVDLYVYRVNDASKDFSMRMKEIRAGVYVAEAEFKLPGHWDLIVSAVKSEEDQLDLARRIFVQY